MYKLCVLVPEPQLEQVKQALFAAGAGRMGNYDSCCWQVLGRGQFRPLAGSDPFLGQQGKLETIAEYKIEMVVADELIADVVRVLRAVHPYEEPAYDLWPLVEIP